MTDISDETNVITLKISDGKEFTIQLEKGDEAEIDHHANTIAGYILENSDEEVTLKILDTEHIEDITTGIIVQRAETIIDSRIGLVRDQKVLTSSLIRFYGLYNLIKGNEEGYEDNEAYQNLKASIDNGQYTEAERNGIAKGLSEEDFLAFYDKFDIMSSLLQIRHKLNDAKTLVGRIDEIKEDQVNNLLGHLGVVTSYSENTKRYQCMVNFKDGFIIHHGRNRTAVALRGYLSRVTGTFYTNNQVLKKLVTHWMKINEIKENPLNPSENTINNIAAKLGTSIEEIEEHYEQTINAIDSVTNDANKTN